MNEPIPTGKSVDQLARGLYDAAELWLQKNPGAAIQKAADAIRAEIVRQLTHCDFHHFFQPDCDRCAEIHAAVYGLTTSPDGKETGRWVQGFPADGEVKS